MQCTVLSDCDDTTALACTSDGILTLLIQQKVNWSYVADYLFVLLSSRRVHRNMTVYQLLQADVGRHIMQK